MRYLLDQFQFIYNAIKDKHEIAILDKHGYDSKRYTVFLTGNSQLLIISHKL